MDFNVFLSGGGTRLAAHLGALKAIEDRSARIAAWSGASAGSLVAAVLAAGFTHEAAFDLMMQTDYRRFLKIRPLRMMRDYGLYSGDAFEKWLDRQLGGARFRSLDVPFSVVATDITTGSPYIFSHDETPDEKIAAAVRCSISIPGVFGVRRIEESVLTDGTLTTVTPEQLFPDETFPSLIVRMLRDANSRLPYRRRFGLASFISRMMEILLRAADDYCQPDAFTHEIRLQLDTESPLSFGITPQAKQQLFQVGYRQTSQLLGGTSADNHQRLEGIVMERATALEKSGDHCNLLAVINS